MAASALRPIAVDFIDLLAGSDCEIEEFKITEDMKKIEIFNNQTENVYNFFKRGDALLLAIKVSGQLLGNPKEKVSIAPGMILIFLGSQEQLNRIRVHLKDVLVNPNS